LDRRYLELADSFNFRVVSPNVDSRIPVDEQLKTAVAIRKVWPHRFAFLGTFSVDGFGAPDFAAKTISRIKECMADGASGIKIWKNIGMVLKDKEGKYVMIDDPAFAPVFRYLEENKIPVMGHLGEPKNCWLPLKEMTDSSNARYYRSNPQYHMYLHPEAPSYEAQISARDNLLRKHPGLDFIGAHLASLEWSVDELAKRMDLFPNLKVDLSARMAHLQYQSITYPERVFDFMIKYQDRILYGTDFEVHDEEGLDPEKVKANLRKGWLDQWIYFATDSVLDVKGLKLPSDVIDKIYFKNAEKYFR
jgi:predicted TIM-barrel fold metal-dependent hydrolase